MDSAQPRTQREKSHRLHKISNIKVGTLNMKGRHTAGADSGLGTSQVNKWRSVNSLMQKQKIGILAVQETHLGPDHLESIEKLYRRSLVVRNSSDPLRATSSAGVAFVLNKQLVDTSSLETRVLYEGRAMLMSVNWHGDCKIIILNIYAPNKASEHPRFWAEIEEAWQRSRWPKPDFMMGDFNIVEDAIDRAPRRMPNVHAIGALLTFRSNLGLSDEWRIENPLDRTFTFRMNVRASSPTDEDDTPDLDDTPDPENEEGALGSPLSNNTSPPDAILSRLDRIYTQSGVDKQVFEWAHQQCSVPTDHDLVTVRYAPKDAPKVGAGRPTMPLYLVNNNRFMDKVELTGKRYLRFMESIPDTADGSEEIQRTFDLFESEIKQAWVEQKKSDRFRIDQRIKTLKQHVRELTNTPGFDKNRALRIEEALCNKQISHLYKKTALKAHLVRNYKWISKAEITSREWLRSSDDKLPRDTLRRLKKEDPGAIYPQYTTNSDEMLEIARDFHENLQKADIKEDTTRSERAAEIKQATDLIPEDQKLNSHEAAHLQDLLSYDDVERSIKDAKAGKAAGMNGIPSEFWKCLLERNKQAVKNSKPGFDATAMLTRVFNSIQKHGMYSESKFALGWMCPIYKKKDRTDFGNYRPITVLNSEYKIMTKALTRQLETVVKSMVNDDQAGFIAGRSILDLIELSKSMIAYAEESSENGAIIALDQEKAYDRIRHDYLFATLKAFGIPNSFIRTVKHLYSNAKTEIAINGILSAPFKVERGVRQGDPLSCLLFNLAIEPLACALRSSPKLKGYEIPGLDTSLIISLFADDATVFLTKADKLSDLHDVLNTWCKASGAKFNTSKTEVLPIGTPHYRNWVVQNRKLSSSDTRIEDGISVKEDGSWITSLGAPLGNNYDAGGPWEPTMAKVKNYLGKWESAHPTFKGKKLIIQIAVGSITHYRTSVQGMPRTILNELQRYIRQTLWGEDKKVMLGLEFTHREKDEGGLGILDLECRNKTIDIMRLKRYLDFSASRPKWAIVTDALIHLTDPNQTGLGGKINSFLQNWSIPLRGRGWGRQLPTSIVRMLQAAKEHDVRFVALKMDQELAGKLPAWHHIGSFGRKSANARQSCLKKSHRIQSTAGLVSLTLRSRRMGLGSEHKHSRHPSCRCKECTTDRRRGCLSPYKCMDEAQAVLDRIKGKYKPYNPTHNDGLSLTKRRIAANVKAIAERGEILFDPSVTCKSDLSECIRIFAAGYTDADRPATRLLAPIQGRTLRNKITVYTDGSGLRSGTTNATCGAGVWFGSNDPRNTSLRIDIEPYTNQVAEPSAVLAALQKADPFAPLLIRSDSETTIEGLTKNLKKWEDTGWIGISNKQILQAAVYHLRKRAAPTWFKWVKGHSGELGNEEADKLAGRAALQPIADDLDLEIPMEFRLPGGKLSAMTSKLVYQALREQKPKIQRPRTELNLQTTREAINDFQSVSPTDTRIWRSLRHPDIRLPIQQFLFKSMHEIHKIGRFWDFAGATDQMECSHCGFGEESMEHILTVCPHPARKLIWSAAEELWPYSNTPWPDISYGLLLGCGILRPVVVDPSARGLSPIWDIEEPNYAPSNQARLLRILISESAFLIWKLRNERVISDEHVSEKVTYKRWRTSIEDRISADRVAASRLRNTGDKSSDIVEGTWASVIHNIDALPLDWAQSLEGIARIKHSRLPRF